MGVIIVFCGMAGLSISSLVHVHRHVMVLDSQKQCIHFDFDVTALLFA